MHIEARSVRNSLYDPDSIYHPLIRYSSVNMQGIESDRYTVNFRSFKKRLQNNTSELQFDPFRHGMTRRITAALRNDLKAVGPELKKQMLTWTGNPNYADMARVKPDDPPPSLEATISSFDARVNDYFKRMNNIREIKVDLSVPVATSEGKNPHFGEQREPYVRL